MHSVLFTNLTFPVSKSCNPYFTKTRNNPLLRLPYQPHHYLSSLSKDKENSSVISKVIKPVCLKSCEPFSKKEADEIVQTLYKLQNLLWNEKKDGCLARAILSIDELKKWGVPEANLSLQLLIGPNLGITLSNGENARWIYHIAAMVVLKDKTRVILDPSIDSGQSLRVHNWASIIIKDFNLPPAPTQIDDYDQTVLKKSLNEYTLFHLPPDRYFSYFINPLSNTIYFSINKIDKAAKQIIKDTLINKKRFRRK